MKRFKVLLCFLLCVAHASFIRAVLVRGVPNQTQTKEFCPIEQSHFIRAFAGLRIGDVALVGGKNASLGEMISQLQEHDIRVPNGFAVTTDAYWRFIEHNGVLDEMRALMSRLDDADDMRTLQEVGASIRPLIINAKIL